MAAVPRPRGLLAAVALAAALLVSPPSMASSSSVVPAEGYVKLQPVVLEMWDKYGVFHMVILELMAVLPDPNGKVPKAASLKIREQLQVYPYEELQRPDAPNTIIKSLAFDTVRAEPGGEMLRDILILKLQFR